VVDLAVEAGARGTKKTKTKAQTQAGKMVQV
jgi:hypothetical protein